MIENTLYFMLFPIFADLFRNVGKRLDKEAKISLKFTVSQNRKQVITIHILSHTYQEAKKIIFLTFFVKNYSGNEAARLVPDLFLFFL